MALRQVGNYSYGDSADDIREELMNYARSRLDQMDHYFPVSCRCGGTRFTLLLDDPAHEASWICEACDAMYLFADHAEEDGDCEVAECRCRTEGGSVFQLGIGLSLFDRSEDVRNVYIGARCLNCGLTACYGEWLRSEFHDYRKLLPRICED